MKKLLALTLVLGLAALSGCAAGDTATPAAVPTAASTTGGAVAAALTLVEKEGLLTAIDTQKSPFKDSGLKITIKKGQDGYALFVKTDKQGNETKDYYKFDFAANTVVKYTYVAAMGNAYYYYYDLQKNELTKVEDGDHKDVTQRLKDAKRWDTAATSVSDDIKALQSYFETQFGKTIEEAVKE
ncbi:MAG: hypothetical protein ACUVR4_07885 [Anaerolineae bacterium]